MKLFGGDHRKTFLQVKTHLVPETTQGSSAGAIGFGNAVVDDVLNQVKVLLHGCKIIDSGFPGG